MSKPPVLYVLEVRLMDTLTYSPLTDRERKRVTFDGPHGKVRAVAVAKEISRMPLYDGVQVWRRAKSDRCVWAWTKQGGISA